MSNMVVDGQVGDFDHDLPFPRFLRALQVIAIGRRPKVTLARIAVLVVTCLVVFKFVLLPIRVTGISMLPTYQDRSVNFVNRLAYLFHPPRRGDVISIRLAEDSEMHLTFMKRVIGLPGDTVAFSAGSVFINGQRLSEPYLKLPSDWSLRPFTLNNQEYFVVGDNRSMPPEDHWHAKITIKRIVGKVIL